MTAIRVRFLHGWLRAAGRGDGALMGSLGDAAGEWPPSPGRLFAALVAGGGTGSHRRGPGDDSELRMIEGSPPPRIVADPPADVARSLLHERFVVLDRTEKNRTQEYAGRSSGISRPGVRLAPRHPEVTYHWPDLHLDADQLLALAWRAARIGYLGTSDAPAQVNLVADPVGDAPTWVPDPQGRTAVVVPYPGHLDVLDRAFEDFTAGRSLPAAVLRREVTRYRSPGETRPPDRAPTTTFVWVEFDSALSGHRVLAVAEAVKGIVLTAFGPDGAPGYLTGHGLATGEARARYWPLPHVGDHGDGRLFGACIALPADCPPADLQRIRARLDDARLEVSGARPRHLSLFSDQPGPWTARPERWDGPDTEWVSATPVVLTRFPQGDPSNADIETLCAQAGLPAPVAWQYTRVPLIGGGVDLTPHQTVRKGNRPRPYGHLRVRFATPVPGPFALGHMRSLGLGLMAPQHQGRPA
jgi:CRISPR-associated protein Csb2